jgi:TatD DNase family protein
MLIDSHCHLDEFLAKGELDAIVQRAREAGVTQMIDIGTHMADWPVHAEAARRHPGTIFWTVGLHPTEVGEDWEEQVATLASWFATDPVPVGIGEVGLDYFHLPSDPAKAAPLVERQKAAFTAQLEIACQLDCPLVVHARKSFDDTVAMIDKSGVDWKRVVYHCFSEDAERVKILNQRGGRASFTGIITYKNGKSVLDAALAQPLDRLMLETDCPWLSPEPFRGQRNEPARTRLVAEKIASETGRRLEEIAKITSDNTRAFFNFSAV